MAPSPGTDRSENARATRGHKPCGLVRARFFFGLRLDDQPWIKDEVCSSVACLEKARGEALEMLAEAAEDHLRHHTSIEVRLRTTRPELLLVLSLSLTTKEWARAIS